MSPFTESAFEETVLEWLKDLGNTIVFGDDVASIYTAVSQQNSLLPKLTRGEVRVKEVEKEL